jgi:predicted DCC family thiol-disulfide oxidoreductase YuxK
MKRPQAPLRVFYDGACSVCTAEMKHYQRMDHHGAIIAVDISSADFDPVPYNLPLASFRYELHVIDQNGVVYRGIEAFQAIWQGLPQSSIYAFMGMLISLPLINSVARLFYKGFARIRRFLPRRHRCDSGSCS